MSLWLCLRFHQLPLQCLTRNEEQATVVLARQRVLRANDCACALGIREGMGNATVRALAGDDPVLLLERDEGAEQRCLLQLCCWAYSITPSLNISGKDCLQLEVGGCLNLFQGLENLLTEIASGLGSRGFHASWGLASTPKAAWLLSFTENELATAIERPLQERLAALPLSLLQPFAGTIDSLRRAGLHTLGDILTLPPSALARRCGKDFHRFLRQALGQEEDLQPDYQPPTTFSDEYWFGYEVQAGGELLPAVQLLLQSLCHFLRNTQLQTPEIQWQLIGIDHSLQDICVRSGTSHSDWQNWFQLTSLRFERLQLKTSLEGIALNCRQLRPGQLENIDLFAPQGQHEPRTRLLDRLRSRLGLQAVQQVGCRDEHLPEFALHTGCDIPLNDQQNKTPCSQRPFWLIPQPQCLRQNHGRLYWNGALDLLYGPERIEDNWWQQAASRDYYIARDDTGHLYWVFRDRLARQWYIHGIFA